MGTQPGVLSRLGLGIAAAVALYAILLGVLLTPPMQRFALYANKINTLFLGDNLNDGTEFGFAQNQVTPYNIHTADGNTLFAWHVLPLDVYTRNERRLRQENISTEHPVKDITKTLAFELLTSTDANVVVSFHGNAGHIAQNQRPATNRFMASQPNTHVLTIDYRGFGHSTGSPTEAGLIADGIALVNWILHVAHIPPDNIVILGQSLGTAVSSAVALHFADPGNSLLPSGSPEMQSLLKAQHTQKPLVFKSVILAAPFNSVPTLLLTYRMGGLIPLLLPLRPVPYLANMLLSRMVDKWETAERLRAYHTTASKLDVLDKSGKERGSLQVIHALNDADIPYHQTIMICRRVLDKRGSDAALDSNEIDATACIGDGQSAGVVDVKREGYPRLRFELVDYGGHNKIITYTPVAAAVARAFQDLFD